MTAGYEPVIGLEVHAELLTEAKIFCGCSAHFGAEPNTNTCPVCLGMPGVLPVLNRRAVELAVRTGLALGCEIAPRSRWARKNYFYPDLPKGYQISQYELPICTGGGLEIEVGGARRRIGLTRIHMEEDTGKNIHDAHSDASLVDFNRSGLPLIEIVTEPELRSPEEAGAFLRKLRTLLRYLEVCDGNMEEGSLRCDANVSVRRRGETRLGTKVEIKNMNSFRAVEKALDYEIRRQIEVLEEGGTLVQETRLWDPDRETTRPMRTKEYEHDYRYFPDPDLLPLEVSPAWVEEVRASLPELPDARRRRFAEQYGLNETDAEILSQRRDLADYYERAVAAHANPRAVANWVRGELLRAVNERGLAEALVIREWPVEAEHLGRLVALIDRGTISGKIAKTVFAEMAQSGEPPEAVVERHGLVQVTDEGAIGQVVRDVLARHPDKVAEYRGGKEKLLGFFVGQVMKETGGRANPRLVNEALRRELEKEN